MHFRVRGSNVQIVRSELDAATGKAKSQPVGSANLKTGEISAVAMEALNPAELQEAKAFIARHRDLEDRRRELEYESLPATLAALREWVRGVDPARVEPAKEEVLRAMSLLRAALAGRRRRGEEAVAA